MPLPQGADYLRSVQNPRIAFADFDLKFSTPELTPQGLPKPYSGGFTTTFKLTRSNSAWAVRCFTRPLRDLPQRYEAISDFISRNGRSHFVQTDYLRQGILVGGAWYPVIKMDWVPGELLNRYVERNIANASALLRTADWFRELVGDLARHGVAHGDLQHGNILVRNGTLCLIDYDGMYLPSIASYGGNNRGYPDYQHPGRTDNDFSARIDDFSATVIYTAILALSQDPSLWQKYDNGENILFCQRDFIDPDKSPLFRDLRALGKPLPEYADRISVLCRCDFVDVPSLEGFLSGVQPVISRRAVRYPWHSPYAIFSAADSGAILESTGQRVEVVGQVVHYYRGVAVNGKPYLFLNMTRGYPHHTFTIVLWSEALKAFGEKYNPMQYVGHWVSVIGVVEAYDDRPEIAVEVPSQITRLKDESEARAKLHMTTAAVPQAAPAQPMAKPWSASPAAAPKHDSRSTEYEVFDRLYGKRSRSTTAPAAPARTSKQRIPRSTSAVASPSTTNHETTNLVARCIFAVVALAALYVLVQCLGPIIGPSPTPSPQNNGSIQPTRTTRPTATPTSVPPTVSTAVPAPSYPTYTVQSGDSLSSIAARFGTTAEAIMELNGLTTTTIYSGTELLIPVGGGTVSPSPASPAVPTPRPSAAGATSPDPTPSPPCPSETGCIQVFHRDCKDGLYFDVAGYMHDLGGSFANTIELPPGEYSYTVSAPRHESLNGTIAVEAGLIYPLSFTCEFIWDSFPSKPAIRQEQ